MAEQFESQKEIRGSQEGVLRSFISIGANVTDTTVTSTLGGVEDVRANVFGRVRGVIDWVESVQKANIDVARRLTDRVDTLTRSLVSGGEQALKTLVLTGRDTSHGVVDTASSTATAFISRPPAQRTPQA